MSSSSSMMRSTAHELLRAGSAGPRRRRIALLSTSMSPWARSFTTSQSRPISRRVRVVEAITPRISDQKAPKQEVAEALKSLDNISAEYSSVVLPGTFVLPPLSGFPKPLFQKMRILGEWLLVRGQEVLTNAAIKFSSKPSFFKRALLKPRNSTVVPTAKALHRAMAEALAAGDSDTLRKVCSRKLATSLLASIDSRPLGRRYWWELVTYTNKLFYPSVRSHRMSYVSRDSNAPIVRQAVVAISSRQRRVTYDAEGNVVPGSEKKMDVVENVVISCLINSKTWEQTDWTLVGTVKPTSLKEWLEEKEAFKKLVQQQ